MKTMKSITVENIVRHIFNKRNVKISSIKVNIAEPDTEFDEDWVEPQYEVELEVATPLSYKKYKKLMIDADRKSDNLFIDITNVDF